MSTFDELPVIKHDCIHSGNPVDKTNRGNEGRSKGEEIKSQDQSATAPTAFLFLSYR